MRTLTTIGVLLLMISSAGHCLAQTELVSDSFDGGTSGAYLGPNWTGCGFFLGAYSKLIYQNNQAGGAGYYSQDCAVYTGYGPFPNDQYATATVVAPNPSSTAQAAVQLRQNAIPSTPESYIACGWNAQDFPADYHYRIWSMAPNPPTGGPSSLYLSSVTPATNDVIWCQVLGTTVTMKVNGTTIATVTDTSGITAGYPGLYYVDPNGGAPSSNDVIFDNFSAGSGPTLLSLVVTPTSATATAGSFVQFTGTATYADGTVVNISNWSSSDNTVATVDMTGLAYAASPGTVTITGTSGTDSGAASLTVEEAQGYTPLVNDSFNGGTSGAYLGPNWTGCGFFLGAYSKLIYQNNQAGGAGYYSQDCAVYTGYGPFPNDQYATATVVAPNPSSTAQAAVQLRQNAIPSTPESYIACGWNAQDFPADYHYRIWSMAPNPPTGGPSSLYLSSVTPATNDVIWCQVLGTTVTMKVNGTTIATVTDTSGITAGYPGLYYIDPNGNVPPTTDVVFDNFVAGQIDGPVIASIAIMPNPATSTAGSYLQFTATGTYTDGSVANITSSVSWSSSNTSVATVNTAGLAYAVSQGSVTITATLGTTIGAANFTVAPAPTPTVTFTGAPANATYNSTFTVTAATNAPVMPTITATLGVCSVSTVTGTPASASATVTMLSGLGTCTLTANWVATANYSAVGPLIQTTTATKIAPTISFTGAPASATYNTAFVVTATTNASTMAQLQGTANICTVGAVAGTPAGASATVTMTTGTGTCTVTATWSADANYSSASSSQSTSAIRAGSAISITSNVPNPSTLRQAVTASFTVVGTGAGPTGSVTVSASTRESCTSTLTSSHSGSCLITFSTAGSKTLTARYGGDSNFNSSTSATVSQTVNSPTVSLSSSTLNYGSVTRGTTLTMAEKITNTGTGALTNFSWSITGTNLSEFTVSSTSCGTPPATLNSGASCVINVTFKPTATGTQTASLRLTDNATNNPQTIGLIGTGR